MVLFCVISCLVFATNISLFIMPKHSTLVSLDHSTFCYMVWQHLSRPGCFFFFFIRKKYEIVAGCHQYSTTCKIFLQLYCFLCLCSHLKSVFVFASLLETYHVPCLLLAGPFSVFRWGSVSWLRSIATYNIAWSTDQPQITSLPQKLVQWAVSITGTKIYMHIILRHLKADLPSS